MKHFCHRLPLDLHHRAIGHCGRGAQTESLPCEATFSEEIPLTQNAYCGFLPDLRHNGEFYLSFLNIKNSIGRIPLNKDRLFCAKRRDLPSAVEGRKKRLGIEFSECLGLYRGCHTLAPLTSSRQFLVMRDI